MHPVPSTRILLSKIWNIWCKNITVCTSGYHWECNMLRSSDYGFQKMINIANRTRGLKAFVYCQADQKLSSSCHLTIVTMSQTSHKPVAKLSSIWQQIVIIGNPSRMYRLCWRNNLDYYYYHYYHNIIIVITIIKVLCWRAGHRLHLRSGLHNSQVGKTSRW